MKKRILIGILCVFIIFSIPACVKIEDTSSQTEPQRTEEDISNVQKEQEEDKIEEPKESTENVQAQEPVMLTVYYSEDAVTFISAEIQVNDLTPEAVLEALISKEAVADDVKLQLFEKKNVDGKETIEIDFNSAFAEYVSRMGTAGEYYVLGSVCNTYLDAYDCEQIKITVDREPLSTGHTEYTGYLTTFS